jgi:hypothetical protein
VTLAESQEELQARTSTLEAELRETREAAWGQRWEPGVGLRGWKEGLGREQRGERHMRKQGQAKSQMALGGLCLFLWVQLEVQGVGGGVQARQEAQEP